MENNVVLDKIIAEDDLHEIDCKAGTSKNNLDVPIKRTKTIMKEKICKVIGYNADMKILDIDFDGYGIRLYDVKDVKGDSVSIKYKGEIGKPNFKCKV